VIIDDGPEREPADKGKAHSKDSASKARAIEASGTVRLSLFGPKGQLRGALLDDGTMVRIGPKHTKHFAASLAPGAKLALRGQALTTTHGLVVEAEELGDTPETRKPAKAHEGKQPRNATSPHEQAV
jgi:hypothetical protein